MTMKQTYTRTMTISNKELAEATIEIHVYEFDKYSNANEDYMKIKYHGLKSWSIVTDEDAAELESEADEDFLDENHEYLVLEFTDGTTSTFRNSHVDMFIY